MNPRRPIGLLPLLKKLLDRNLDLALMFVVITLVGLAFGSFAQDRLRGASQATEVALESEASLRTSFCETSAGLAEHVDLKEAVSFQRDPTILSSLKGAAATVRLRQQRPHRAEYHPRRSDFKPRIILVKLSLNEDTWCVADISEST